MAKKAKIEANKKRMEMVARFQKRREDLKNRSRDMSLSDEERFAAALKLAELPRNSSKTRLRNRCDETGRPRSNYRKFGLSRIAFRERALKGYLPGVTKASW